MINKVTLIGRLGKDPESRTLPSGATYVRFTIATGESYKDKDGEWKENTEWHNIIMWRDMAERAVSSLKKGMLIYLEGKLTTQSWQDTDGKTLYRTEVAANSYRMLEKRENTSYNESSPNYSEPKEPVKNNTSNIETDDDLPF